jgi:16S rRNA (guanine966-N2)-methyltransferase
LKRGSVRIVAGRWKGRSLEVPAGARPTSGRAREALFSILQDSLPGARVLDLYSGSGALGLEAVSRGAARAVLVEQRPGAIDRGVQRLGASEQEVEVLRGDAGEAVSRLAQQGEQFDIVFSDPPYDAPAEQLVPPEVARLIAPGGVLILQSDRPARPFVEPEGWTLVARRGYGRNVFLFLAPSSSSFDLPAPDRF